MNDPKKFREKAAEDHTTVLVSEGEPNSWVLRLK